MLAKQMIRRLVGRQITEPLSTSVFRECFVQSLPVQRGIAWRRGVASVVCQREIELRFDTIALSCVVTALTQPAGQGFGPAGVQEDEICSTIVALRQGGA